MRHSKPKTISSQEFLIRLDRVRALIHALSKTASGTVTDFGRGIAFQRENLGGLALDERESKFYRDVLGKLHEAAGPARLSKGTVEMHLQEAILKTVDILDRDASTPFKARLDKAIAELQVALSASPREYRLSLPIEGCDPSETPHVFGGGRLVDRAKSDRFVKWRIVKEPFRSALAKGTAARTWLTIRVHAGDSETARVLALEGAHEIVDVLNFYADLMVPSWQRPRVAIEGTAPRDRTFTASFGAAIVSASGALSQFWTPTRLPAGRRDALAKRHGYWRAAAIVKKHDDRRTYFERRMVAGMRLAGRASTIVRPADRVLGYVMALDAVVGAEKSTADKIATRAVHVLGGKIEERRRHYERVEALYRLRSEIVHNARSDVVDEQVAEARYYAKRTILTLLLDPRFRHVKSESDFSNWIQDSILTSPRHIR